MRKVTLILFLLCTTFLKGQNRGDLDYIFTSLATAEENPEVVYHLQLSKQKLEKFPSSVFKFVNLKTLDLSKNKISMLPAEIGQLEQLKSLDLSRNKIYTLPPQLKELQELETLLLAKNDVEEVPFEIGELSSLKKLDLWSNNVKKIDENLKTLKNLEFLDLRGMLLFDELKQQLQNWLPETDIQFSGGCSCRF